MARQTSVAAWRLAVGWPKARSRLRAWTSTHRRRPPLRRQPGRPYSRIRSHCGSPGTPGRLAGARVEPWVIRREEGGERTTGSAVSDPEGPGGGDVDQEGPLVAGGLSAVLVVPVPGRHRLRPAGERRAGDSGVGREGGIVPCRLERAGQVPERGETGAPPRWHAGRRRSWCRAAGAAARPDLPTISAWRSAGDPSPPCPLPLPGRSRARSLRRPRARRRR